MKDGDLVAGTHGRSFWILDDLTPLRGLTREALEAEAHLFEPKPTFRALNMLGKTDPGRIGPGKNYLLALGAAATFEETETPEGVAERVFLDAGHNPPDGAVITYHLRERAEEGAALTFLDPDGREVRRFCGLPAEAGMNRIAWDMRHDGPREAAGDDDELASSPGRRQRGPRRCLGPTPSGWKPPAGPSRVS